MVSTALAIAGLACKRACNETAASAISRVTELMLLIASRRPALVFTSPDIPKWN